MMLVMLAADMADAIIVALVSVGFGAVIGLIAWIVKELISLGKNQTATTELLVNVVADVAGLVQWRDSITNQNLEELMERRKYDWTHGADSPHSG